MRTRKGQLFTDLVLDIFKLSGLLVDEGDQLTKPVKLTSARWKVLGAVAYSPIPMTVAQIARAMGQTRQSVQRIADAMTNDRLLIYKDNPDHKRAKLLSLTKKGKKAFDIMEETQAPWANQASEDITIADLNTAISVVRNLIKKFDP